MSATTAKAGWTRSEGERLGPWILEEPLGRGGFSEVWRVRRAKAGRGDERGDERRYALKVVVHHAHAEQLQAEASSLGLVRGRGVVAVHDVALDHDPPYLVMDYLRGGDLRRKLAGGRLAAGEAIQHVERVLELLTRLQREGIVHGDLKPENLLFDEEGALHVSDFGLSRKIAQQTATLSVSLSAADARLAGTIEYMAPEQRAGQKPSHRSDVYAVGVILHELLLGERPQGVAEPPSRRRPELPGAVDRLLARALAGDSRRRWESAAAFLTALRLELWNDHRNLDEVRTGLLHRASIVGTMLLLWLVAAIGFGLLGANIHANSPPPNAAGEAVIGSILVGLLSSALATAVLAVGLWRYRRHLVHDVDIAERRIDSIRGWRTPTSAQMSEAALVAEALPTRGTLSTIATIVRWRLRRWLPRWLLRIMTLGF